MPAKRGRRTQAACRTDPMESISEENVVPPTPTPSPREEAGAPFLQCDEVRHPCKVRAEVGNWVPLMRFVRPPVREDKSSAASETVAPSPFWTAQDKLDVSSCSFGLEGSGWVSHDLLASNIRSLPSPQDVEVTNPIRQMQLRLRDEEEAVTRANKLSTMWPSSNPEDVPELEEKWDEAEKYEIVD